jgi:hypothetical protein
VNHQLLVRHSISEELAQGRQRQQKINVENILKQSSDIGYKQGPNFVDLKIL